MSAFDLELEDGTITGSVECDVDTWYLRVGGRFSSCYAVVMSITNSVTGEDYILADSEKIILSYNANTSYDDIDIDTVPENKTITQGFQITLSSTMPSRAGYDFLGWGTDPASTKATYKAGGTYTFESNTTLYAIWEIQTLYFSNGRKITSDNGEVSSYVVLPTSCIVNYEASLTGLRWRRYYI